jgi:hypothetical protein
VAGLLDAIFAEVFWVKTFWDFEGAHAGETVWVLGSGKTLEFVPSDFFHDKTVVATNKTFHGRVKQGFSVSNHWNEERVDSLWFVTTEVEQVPASDRACEKPTGDRVLFVPSIDQKYDAFSPGDDWPERGRFVVGPTSLHLSLHWAVWLGAKHIVLVGADCGVIDGENNASGYYNETDAASSRPHAHHKLWERTLVEMAQKIRTFGVSVHSLNPWVTFNLEGHTWTQER